MIDDKKLKITVIVDGIPKIEEFPENLKVEEVIKKLLSPGEKNNWNNYELRNSSQQALDSSRSLEEDGVKEGDTLSLTKKHGGGGTDVESTYCRSTFIKIKI